jgi:ABC-2 type transport system ATP-binding protein
MTPAIQTRDLAKRYRRVSALSDCTITVPEGTITALIGPNGAGKTTLLRLLAGLAGPTAGEVTVLGDTPRQDPGFLARIGFLAQEIPLYRRYTAEDHIGIGAHLNRDWDGASARDRLRTLHIPLDRAVGKLSGGQRAQVALALTLAKKPSLLLLDEPVAALDPVRLGNSVSWCELGFCCGIGGVAGSISGVAIACLPPGEVHARPADGASPIGPVQRC